jgi:hypothetical protein
VEDRNSEPVVGAAAPGEQDALDGKRPDGQDTVGATGSSEQDAADATGSEEQDAQPTRPEPRLITRVVCGYRLGFLPGEWLQTWRRLDRVLARAGLKVKATLSPLEELPSDTGILVVSPDLREAAREYAVPGTPILVTPSSSAAGAFADLVARLEAGTELRAEKIDPAEADAPKIVSYTGYTRID